MDIIPKSKDCCMAAALVIQQPLLGRKTSGHLIQERMEVLELAMKIVGFLLFGWASLILLLGDILGFSDLNARLIVSSSISLLGFLLFIWATRGLLSELHIDSSGEEIRVGSRDSHGNFYMSKAYPFDDIVSVFIRRSRNADALVSLYIRTRLHKSPQKLVRGTEKSLVPILEFIASEHSKFRNSSRAATTIRSRRLIQSKLV